MNDPVVAIAWEGLPIYGARLIAAGRHAIGECSLTVLATRPSVPLESIESTLGQRVHWLSRDRCTTWRELGQKTPNIFIHTGWAYPYFNALAEEVRRSGGRVISMVDNRWKANFRQLVGALYFRLKLRKRFYALWVPGSSGLRLARFLGMPGDRVLTGMYGADPKLFYSGPPLGERPKRIVFVGQYVDRKGVDLLSIAWARVHRQNPDWSLDCFGSGPEAYRLLQTPGCSISPFLQPEEIAAAMRNARFLVLPSRDDHWGLVVHEAALSGCGLIVSNAVGAGADLVRADNGRVFVSGDVSELEKSLGWPMAQNADEMVAIRACSLRMAALFGPSNWSSKFKQLVTM